MTKFGIALVTDYQRYLGFRLTSYSNIFHVSTIEDGNKLIKKLFSEQKYGLILVSSYIYDDDDEDIKLLTKKTFPLLVEVPISGKNYTMLAESKIIEYLQRSIGYSIKF